MRPDEFRKRVLRGLAGAAVAVAGVVTLVGSGGGALGFPEIDYTNIGGGSPLPVYPSAYITPSRTTVQAASSVQFSVTAYQANAPIAYQWLRDGVEIAGATAATYTLSGAQMSDDGARFQVRVAAANGTVSASASLFVSPFPPVVFQDGDLPLSNWSVAATAEPVTNGPAFTIEQASDGGLPGAYRRVDNRMTAGVSRLQLLHYSLPTVYDPGLQGAINTIGLAFDGRVAEVSPGVYKMDPVAWPMFEQSGRMYRPAGGDRYYTSPWSTQRWTSLTPDRFEQLDGPPCESGNACPDFSASGPPLRFGIGTLVKTTSASSAGSIVLGLDNWEVVVWRK